MTSGSESCLNHSRTVSALGESPRKGEKRDSRSCCCGSASADDKIEAIEPPRSLLGQRTQGLSPRVRLMIEAGVRASRIARELLPQHGSSNV